MKNVTISMADDTLREVRVNAAKAGKSVSRYVADIVQAAMSDNSVPLASNRESQIEALERILSGPKWDLLRDGRLPTAEERNER